MRQQPGPRPGRLGFGLWGNQGGGWGKGGGARGLGKATYSPGEAKHYQTVNHSHNILMKIVYHEEYRIQNPDWRMYVVMHRV